MALLPHNCRVLHNAARRAKLRRGSKQPMRSRTSWRGWGCLLLCAVALGPACAGKSRTTDTNTAGAAGTGGGLSGTATAGAATAGDVSGHAGAGAGGAGGSVAIGGTAGGASCQFSGCTDGSHYCSVVMLNGGLLLDECRAFPTSCRTCACAIADFKQFLSQQTYGCDQIGCHDATGRVSEDETSDKLILTCGSP